MKEFDQSSSTALIKVETESTEIDNETDHIVYDMSNPISDSLARMEKVTPQLIKALIKKAKAGNMMAMRYILDRTFPVRHYRSIAIDIDKIETLSDIEDALRKIVINALKGKINADEAKNLIEIVFTLREFVVDAHISDEFKTFKALQLQNPQFKNFYSSKSYTN